MSEEDVRFAVDSFNRFMRPDVEARIVEITNKAAVIEFSGAQDRMDYYINYLQGKLESATGAKVEIGPVRKNETCVASFSLQTDNKENDDPLQQVLHVMDKYYEGVKHSNYGFED